MLNIRFFTVLLYVVLAVGASADTDVSEFDSTATHDGQAGVVELDILPPEIVLQDILLVSLDLQAAKISVVVNVKNPNEKDVVVESISYRVALNEIPVKNGVLRQEAQFPAKTARTVRVPVTLAYDDNLPNIIAALNNPNNSVYEISGAVNVKGYEESFPFYHKDKLVMPASES